MHWQTLIDTFSFDERQSITLTNILYRSSLILPDLIRSKPDLWRRELGEKSDKQSQKTNLQSFFLPVSNKDFRRIFLLNPPTRHVPLIGISLSHGVLLAGGFNWQQIYLLQARRVQLLTDSVRSVRS